MSLINDNIIFHLVDDNDIDIAVNTKLLQLSGITPNIHAYNNATRFLQAINANQELYSTKTHVILLDIMMPGMNGFECLDELSKLPEKIKTKLKVFMLSSSIDRNDIRLAESYDLVQRVLEKPLDIYLLKKTLEGILE
ncbi:MAG: response regulator [Flavobacteriales bacterium]|nr:response regulator [Flavobacteriales bacterium]